MSDLRVVPFTPKPVDDTPLQEQLVAKLRELLADAEAGRVLAFAGCFETADEWRHVRVTKKISDAVKMTAIAMHSFNEELRSD